MMKRLQVPGGARWMGAAIAIAMATASGAARAQQTFVPVNVIVAEPDTTSTREVLNDTSRYYISYADCMADAKLTFPVTLNNFSPGDNFEIWVGEGQACDDPALRSTEAGDCREVKKLVPTEKSFDVELSAKAIAGALSNVTDCVDSGVNTGARAAVIWFLLTRTGAGVLVPQEDLYPWSATKVDLLGPLPPADITVSFGEESLVVEFERDQDPDVVGYRFYCEEASAPPGSTAAGTGGAAATTATGGGATAAGAGGGGGATAAGAGGAGGATTATGAGGAGGSTTGAGGGTGSTGAGVGGSGGAGGAPPTSGTGNTTAGTGAGGGAGGAGGDGGGSFDPTCYAATLVAGQLPPDGLGCGDQDDGKAIKLRNGTRYAVGVANTDEVGNQGKLSELGCETPSPIEGFFDAYSSAGGLGGGGFCALGRSPVRDALASVFSVGLVAVGLLVRRRRRGNPEGRRER